LCVEVEGLVEDQHIKDMMNNLEKEEVILYQTVACSYEIPWVPCTFSDLDVSAGDCIYGGEGLAADHPGFNDEEYKARRNEISRIASQYKSGQKIPQVEYQPKEIDTWRTIFKALVALHSTHACAQYQRGFLKLVANTNCNEKNIPQLQEVSEYLNSQTGFSLRPVTGLLSSRHFLAGLALRCFHSTQYIRHHAAPFYTPEPDIVHEIMGHVPMLFDPEFADFSQAMGLASLGGSDEFVEYLAACYWFTIEFGLIKQRGEKRAFGAGLLSSVGELQYCLSDKPQVAPFDAFNVKGDYPITQFQPTYYIVEDFQTLTEQITALAKSKNTRKWTPHYNIHNKRIYCDRTN